MFDNKVGIYHFKAEKWKMTDFALIEKYREHNFDSVCFYCNFDSLKPVKDCINYAREIGLNVDTVHGPFSDNDKIWKSDYQDYVNLLKDCIKLCGEMNIKYFVLHTSAKECISFSESGLNNFKELVKLAESLNVVILVENLRTVDHMIFLLEQIKSQNFQVCIDFGHANVWCYPPKYLIEKYREKIKAVHIHDNFGEDFGDKHLIPFKGNINWEEVIPLLFKYYNGPITLELDNFKTEEFKYSDIDEYLHDARESADKLKKLIK